MMHSMIMNNLLRHRLPVWAPADEAGATTTVGEEETGKTTESAATETTTDQASSETKTSEMTTDDAKTEETKPWYDSREWGDEKLKQHLIKTGYHKGSVEDALERALKGEITASAKLGKDPARLMDAPAEGQNVNEWLKANAKHLGVPESADKYDVKLPQDLPEGLPIDQAMLEAAKVNALEMGLPPSVLQANVDFYAKHMADNFTAMAAKATEAQEKLDTDLKEAWGASWNDNQQLAVRGFQAIAAEMKLDPDVTKNVASKLNSEMGDAGLLKFFHGLAVKLGDDTLAIPQGGNAPALALADAQQRKEVIMAKHTGAMAKANQAGDRVRHKALQSELKGLNKIIAQHSNG